MSDFDRAIAPLVVFAAHTEVCAKRSDKWADCTCGLDKLLVTICRTYGEAGVRAAQIAAHWYTDFAEFEGDFRARIQRGGADR